MPGGRWADLAAQSIAHAFVAALATEALLRAWRVRAPADRLALRLAALALPALVTPAVFLALPLRASEAFHDRFALLVTRRYEDLRALGADAFHLGVGLLAASGAALFLMDLVPLLRAERRVAAAAAPPERLASALARAAQGLGRGAPGLRFLDVRAPALFCAGARRPAVVVSQGALALLDDEELLAALAHEVAHVRQGDPALSWALMAARALLFFNPAAQVLARAIARDAEGRADAALEGERERLALASALVKLHRASAVPPPPPRRTLPFAGALAEPLRAARTHALEARCRALLAPPAAPLPWRPLRVALAASSLAALAVLVA
jgi:BlaR1 peptidase M56